MRIQLRNQREHGFVSITVLIVSLLSMLIAGFIITNAKIRVDHTYRVEQIMYAELLAQDALEMAKLKLSSEMEWRGTSMWIVRDSGTFQYSIQNQAQSPITNDIVSLAPSGVMITGLGKTSNGSIQKLMIWYDPATAKTYAYKHA